jgi:hypothetical protein
MMTHGVHFLVVCCSLGASSKWHTMATQPGAKMTSPDAC